MGFLDNLRRNANNLPEEWGVFNQEKQLKEIIDESFKKPQAIFKHSITCGISAKVKDNLATGAEDLSEIVDIHYLDLINFRDVSNLVAKETGVVHQSPQIIILVNGEVSIADSHFVLSVDFVKKHLESIQ